jgi:3-oxoacyl-(acyl-carrier-protein) reductase
LLHQRSRGGRKIVGFLGLEGRYALVTGAGQGIGRAIALRLADEGVNVAVNDLDSDTAKKVVGELEQKGVKAIAVAGDISKPQIAAEITEQVIETWGKCNILINNAGINRDSLLVKMSDQDWEMVLNVNLRGSFNCIREVARHMMTEKYGKIVNLASIAALGNRGTANYSASKAGIIALSKSAALELASYGINVNCISPGFVDTDMFQSIPEKIKQKIMSRLPLSRPARPEEITDLILFLVSERSSYITGQVVVIDGGITLGYI